MIEVHRFSKTFVFEGFQEAILVQNRTPSQFG